MGLELEFTEGMQFDKGYISPYMVTDAGADGGRPRGRLRPGPPGQDLLGRRPAAAAGEGRPSPASRCSIVAEDVDGEALSTLVVNKIRGLFVSVAVKAPGFGDRRKAMLEDLAVLTGAQVVAPEVGLKLDQVGLEVLGTARRVVVTKDDTTIVDGGGEARRGRGPDPPDPQRDREHRLRLGQGEAAGAAGQAGRRRLRHRRRRGHRGGAQGAQAPASRTRSRRPGQPSRRASSPAAAPPSCTPWPCSTTTSASPATRRPASRSSAGRPTSRCAGSPRTPGQEGYVVVYHVREGGPAHAASTPRPGSTATWSPRACSTRSR